MIEKLVRFPAVLHDTFDQLTQAWSAEGFSVQSLHVERAEMCYRGKMFGQVRVDVGTYCYTAESSTYVQMVVTSGGRLPGTNASTMLMVDDDMLRQKVTEVMDAVLYRVGEYQVVSREDAQAEGIKLHDFEQDQRPVRRKNRWGIVMIGFILMVLGSLLAYLNLSMRISFGSANLWSFAALGGVLVFCMGIFSMIWGNR